MNRVDLDKIQNYVEDYIGQFHQQRLDSFTNFVPRKVLLRKNPYLFRAKGFAIPADLVKSLMEAHLSSSEETLFGDFLEGLAIFVCREFYNGHKSGIEGIDLEFNRDGIRWLVAIKSGPNWANSSQIKKMTDSFNKAVKTIRTSGSKIEVRCVNGCCYGRSNQLDNGTYSKLSGQAFWEFISGDTELYIDLVKPLGHRARERNDAFKEAYEIAINRFEEDFRKDYFKDYQIDWAKLVEDCSKRPLKKT